MDAGMITGAIGLASTVGMYFRLRAQRDSDETKALIGRIERMEAREATHEKQLDDLRSRATTAEQSLAQTTWQLRDCQADLVTMSGEVTKRDQRIEQLETLVRGIRKENVELRRSMGQRMPSDPPPLKRV